MSKVYVIQQPKPRAADNWIPDLTPAAKFGAIHYIFSPSEAPHRDLLAAYKKIAEALEGFNIEEDYVCWCNFGDPAGLWLVIAYLYYHLGAANFLYWSRGRDSDGKISNRKGFYTAMRIDLNEFSRRFIAKGEEVGE